MTMKERVKTALWTTFTVIADDLLQCTGQKFLSRDEVFEASADRIGVFGNDQDAADVFFNMNSNQQNEMKMITFPENKYY